MNEKLILYFLFCSTVNNIKLLQKFKSIPEYIDLYIRRADRDVSRCDYPLDSEILSVLGYKMVKWTKIDSIDSYNSIQDEIDNQCEIKGYDSRIEFDFASWGASDEL